QATRERDGEPAHAATERFAVGFARALLCYGLDNQMNVIFLNRKVTDLKLSRVRPFALFPKQALEQVSHDLHPERRQPTPGTHRHVHRMPPFVRGTRPMRNVRSCLRVRWPSPRAHPPSTPRRHAGHHASDLELP